jgi:RNA polymerase sigma-70 factor (ECF subfamily)
MAQSAGSKTSLTLLGRLQQTPTDQGAWDLFVERYGPKVYTWCRRWRLQESDAQDVTQNVLLELARQMQSFVYRQGGTFRGWLRTVAYRAYCDYLTARQRVTPGSGDDAVLAQLSSVEARTDLLQQLEEEYDRELLDEATGRVRLRVQPHTWDAFVLTAVEGLSGADVARRLGMQIGAVYVARGKVQKMLQEEVRRLEDGSNREVVTN